MFFSRKKVVPPVEDSVISWLEDTYRWIIYEFGIDTITQKKVLLPTKEDFPVEFENSEVTALQILPIIANQMNVDYKKIDLYFYDNNIIELSNELGHKIYTQPDLETKMHSGYYGGIDKNGQYIIYLDTNKFKHPENLIATIAHEIAHIILSNIKSLKEYDEYLVDLLTVIYGIGIFNANVAFQFFKSNEGWGYSKQGYLRQQDWAYALAIYSFIRKEKECQWSQYLIPNVKADFKKSLEYIKLNPFKF